MKKLLQKRKKLNMKSIMEKTIPSWLFILVFFSPLIIGFVVMIKAFWG